ncbi:ribosome small subunit-dependent GTPase A [Paenibacillus woosongensis]|uniref:Small ribosomal subunit biogenesis GTPase RsgA n=1 Tax=Paenibacillus woosongensis TaxID=307580 RepID=A0A7X3CLR1_9BACL|nr:ribosome small subunit-dependent GTPase A [Paenibacillus woosongensis]MUG44863.1 ribosome small subunit-dependent GTPase A [Paenibacillus woosongensis]GIP57998.1 putative ribosome biogenesis GTPase RsgA [Paenibacillus woosongensis]
MPEGLIVKALSGYYYVKPLASAEEIVLQCRGRGIFKKKGITPLVGDQVLYTPTENGEGTVDEILPRDTELIRPPIANASHAVLLFSVKEPDLNLQLLDKFLVHIEHAGLRPLICLTKEDLLDEQGDEQDRNLTRQVGELYEKVGYEVIITSSLTGSGTDEVKARLAGHISVFAGQSGVGKSSLLNAMLPGLSLETSEISLKLGRGRHTTRHVELIELDNGGYVADTPGFSQLDFLELGVEELSSCFIEFSEYAEQCKFRGCSHLHEPGCRVRAAVEEGEIVSSRYKHYVQFYEEMKDKKRRY